MRGKISSQQPWRVIMQHRERLGSQPRPENNNNKSIAPVHLIQVPFANSNPHQLLLTSDDSVRGVFLTDFWTEFLLS